MGTTSGFYAILETITFGEDSRGQPTIVGNLKRVSHNGQWIRRAKINDYYGFVHGDRVLVNKADDGIGYCIIGVDKAARPANGQVIVYPISHIK